MPLREYKCLDCGHVQENLERTPADTLTQCVSCGSGKLERIISTYGGYSMDSGPSSVRPRGAGSFKRRK